MGHMLREQAFIRKGLIGQQTSDGSSRVHHHGNYKDMGSDGPMVHRDQSTLCLTTRRGCKCLGNAPQIKVDCGRHELEELVCLSVLMPGGRLLSHLLTWSSHMLWFCSQILLPPDPSA